MSFVFRNTIGYSGIESFLVINNVLGMVFDEYVAIGALMLMYKSKDYRHR